ncbi:MAG: hypothetical protein MZV49_21320 [Rhodopseudomonas palustris]|nr:hypothetical protein [Rhodopseudomonas palustris]
MQMNMVTKMILFLLTFLCLYGGINFYVFFRARSVFHFSGLLQGLILILIILLIIAPVLVRIAESLHLRTAGAGQSPVSAMSGWLLSFLFFFLSVSLEFIRIGPQADRSFGRHGHAQNAHVLACRHLLAVVLVVYGYIDAQQNPRETPGNQNGAGSP